MSPNSMRVLITEKCNSKCRNCFNSVYREKKEIDITTYIKLCEYLSRNKIKRVKIMGGEPTVHSAFEHIITISQSYFESVVIFTNALNDRIMNVHPRRKDTIVYNFNFFSSRFNKEKFLLDRLGNRRLEVQIGNRTNVEHVTNRLSLLKSIPNLKINLTLDCMENIFDDKIKLEQKFITISDYIRNELKTDYLVDHKIPFCFWTKNTIVPDAMCLDNCVGLIDSSLRFRFCNQFEPSLCDLIDVDGEFVSFDKIMSILEMCYVSKIDSLKGERCGDCNHFPHKCNGGCFAHKTIVKLS